MPKLSLQGFMSSAAFPILLLTLSNSSPLIIQNIHKQWAPGQNLYPYFYKNIQQMYIWIFKNTSKVQIYILAKYISKKKEDSIFLNFYLQNLHVSESSLFCFCMYLIYRYKKDRLTHSDNQFNGLPLLYT